MPLGKHQQLHINTIATTHNTLALQKTKNKNLRKIIIFTFTQIPRNSEIGFSNKCSELLSDSFHISELLLCVTTDSFVSVFISPQVCVLGETAEAKWE